VKKLSRRKYHRPKPTTVGQLVSVSALIVNVARTVIELFIWHGGAS
jgi:hypothetical protein